MELNTLLEKLSTQAETLKELREIILANAVMIGEVPAPTFWEKDRVSFMCDRFNEGHLQNVGTDEKGNVTAVLPGRTGKKNILVVAHTDTPFAQSINHTITVEQDRMTGPGVADNAIGLATMVSLPILLEKLGIQLDANLIFLGHSRALGYGDLEGFRFFLNNTQHKIDAAICAAGVHLGRVSYTSVGMLRGVIAAEGPTDHDWTRIGGGGGATGAIANLTRVIDSILEIPLPQKPKTSVILGSISGGTAFNTTATHAELGFEVRSEDAGMVEDIYARIEEITEQVQMETTKPVSLRVLARRTPGGVPFTHPMVKTARKVIEALGIEPRIAPSTGALSALIDHNIPGVTLGITEGSNVHEMNESIAIEPIFKGAAQLIAMLSAIDAGICNEDA